MIIVGLISAAFLVYLAILAWTYQPGSRLFDRRYPLIAELDRRQKERKRREREAGQS